MKFEITLTYTYEAFPRHYREGSSPEDMLSVDLEGMRTSFWPEDLSLDNHDIVSITGRVVEPA